MLVSLVTRNAAQVVGFTINWNFEVMWLVVKYSRNLYPKNDVFSIEGIIELDSKSCLILVHIINLKPLLRLASRCQKRKQFVIRIDLLLGSLGDLLIFST